jgi:hypothetical protein
MKKAFLLLFVFAGCAFAVRPFTYNWTIKLTGDTATVVKWKANNDSVLNFGLRVTDTLNSTVPRFSSMLRNHDSTFSYMKIDTIKGNTRIDSLVANKGTFTGSVTCTTLTVTKADTGIIQRFTSTSSTTGAPYRLALNLKTQSGGLQKDYLAFLVNKGMANAGYFKLQFLVDNPDTMFTAMSVFNRNGNLLSTVIYGDTVTLASRNAKSTGKFSPDTLAAQVRIRSNSQTINISGNVVWSKSQITTPIVFVNNANGTDTIRLVTDGAVGDEFSIIGTKYTTPEAIIKYQRLQGDSATTRYNLSSSYIFWTKFLRCGSGYIFLQSVN